MSVLGEVLVGLVILVGLAGIVVQVLPGNVLVLGAVGVWAWMTGGDAWWVLAAAAVVVILAELGQWLLAGRHLRKADVPFRTIGWAGVAGIVGFVVIPVIGLFLFFPAAVYLLEVRRRSDRAAAWAATKAAIQATGITILVQLAGGLLATTIWVLGLIIT
ncbi:hypothetical protein Xcel_0722 [Xylanimonas cellulosilytica DSM 15894]|uniref:DUF456 domain-containing protein n=1 Tax=Xylanimonas cellulosilytica (strain DSM 15894 / JCM 12276 / CECT 5975 / KCTC 9989 / LMG 20990 / NBRC 107835 / XIL07) TaxID=446471 RepID=D1BXF1_XYLCX|nr:DUF456 domain-containing protein [Xylanimonas cellulosilytica]ACZ29761.1 hypothetical protein Xcel_0722 [Xylanimonas cellulosilytica DSM 15894]